MRRFIRYGKFYVYILECQNNTYYTGSTNDLKKRVKLHNSGKGAKYTRDRGPVKLVYAKEYRYFKNSINAERQIKKLRRSQKEKLIKNYFCGGKETV